MALLYLDHHDYRFGVTSCSTNTEAINNKVCATLKTQELFVKGPGLSKI